MLATFHKTPREELDKPLFNPGIYQYRLEDVDPDAKSKAGNPYYKVKLTIINADGRELTMFDQLSLQEKMHWKLAHFCDSINASEMYDNEQIDFVKLVGRYGYVELKEEEYQGKKYLKVKDYVKPENQPSNENISNENNFQDDDVPF